MSEPIDQFLDQPIETGIVTATVNEPEVVMTPEGVQAAKALVNLPDISPVAVAQLAREIAQDIGELPAILNKFKLTQSQYDFLEKHNKFFRSTLETEISNWQGIKKTEVRLRLQAQAALEQQMPVIANRMGNQGEKLGDAVEAFKTFARIAGVDSPPATGAVAGGERYVINIDLGADTRIVIGATQGTAPGAGPDQAGAVQPNHQGASETRALPALPAR